MSIKTNRKGDARMARREGGAKPSKTDDSTWSCRHFAVILCKLLHMQSSNSLDFNGNHCTHSFSLNSVITL